MPNEYVSHCPVTAISGRPPNWHEGPESKVNQPLETSPILIHGLVFGPHIANVIVRFTHENAVG